MTPLRGDTLCLPIFSPAPHKPRKLKENKNFTIPQPHTPKTPPPQPPTDRPRPHPAARQHGTRPHRSTKASKASKANDPSTAARPPRSEEHTSELQSLMRI